MSEATTHTPSTHPHILLSVNVLSDAEKRSIIASWASDRHVVMDKPSLRQLNDETIVHLDDILEALKSLDRVLIRNTLCGRLPTRRTFRRMRQ